MKRRLFVLPLLACLLLALVLGGQAGSAKPLPRPPKGFFGVAPQTELTELDARYMRAGGIESIRLPLLWSSVQPFRNSPYDWSGFDAMVEVAARAGLRVFPSLASPPRWVTRKETTLPVSSAKQRQAWSAFLAAAVARYGPGGEFWAQHGGIGVNYEPAIPVPVPIREWQVWNEPNFFYFAYPVSVAPVREAGDDLQPGDQSGRPAGESRPRRPLRRAEREGQAGDAGDDLPTAPLRAFPGCATASTGSTSTPTRSTAKSWRK